MQTKHLILLLSLLLITLPTFAQNDSTENDLSFVEGNQFLDNKVKGLSPFKRTGPPSPHRAALYSAVLPGLGQIYNGRYWKVPLVWGGIGTLAYFIGVNNRLLLDARELLFMVIDGDPRTMPPPGTPSQAALERAVDFNRRNRDLLSILTVAAYLLNVAEATVDAHLQGFDLSDDLSFNFDQSFIQTATSYEPVLNLSFAYRF